MQRFLAFVSVSMTWLVPVAGRKLLGPFLYSSTMFKDLDGLGVGRIIEGGTHF